MIRRIRACAVLTAGVLFLTGLTVAQEKNGAKPAEEPTYKYVNVQADKTRYKWGNPEIAILTGNVKITQGDTVLTADKIEYNNSEDVQTAVATGKLKIVDPETEITGDRGTAYFNEKRAVIQGNVTVVAKPKPEPDQKGGSTLRSERREKVVITCDTIEYFYKKKEAVATGNLKIVQKDRTLTAAKAFYQVRPELLTLTGPVKGKDSKGQTFSAPGPVTACLKEGEEWLEMEHAVGTFRVKEEAEEEAPKTSAPTSSEVKVP